MILRAQECKKKYESMVSSTVAPQYCTYVNRESEYLDAHSSSHLKNYLQKLQQKKHAVSKKKNSSDRANTVKKRIINSSKKVTKKQLVNNTKRHLNKHALFIWPLEKKEFWLSSFFGPRKKPDRSWGFHYGIDMAALKGTLVRSAASGTVVYAGYQRGYGNTVLISHSNRYTTRYAHLDSITVSQGAVVSVGRIIGAVGDTGYTITRGRDASHLHFEVSIRGKQVNPLPLLPNL